jgi:hypothetical protein
MTMKKNWGIGVACHYPDLCMKGAFPSSRSDGLNLAVGFNPR